MEFIMLPSRWLPKIIVCLVAFATGTADVSAQTPRSDVEALERMLIDLNQRVLVEYVLHNNTALLEEVARNDFFLVGPAGIEPRKQVIATVGNLEADSVSVKNTEIRLYGSPVASSAVLAGRLRAKGSLGGRPLPVLTYLSVYVRDGDKWRLAARSLTPLMSGTPNN
jgi:hypothetical protein